MLDLAVSIAHRLVVRVLDAALDVAKEEGLFPFQEPLTWWVARLNLFDDLGWLLLNWLMLARRLISFLFLILRLLFLLLLILLGFVDLLLPFVIRASSLVLIHWCLIGLTFFSVSSIGCGWLLFWRVGLIASWRWGNLLFLRRIGRLGSTLLPFIGSIFISIFVIFVLWISISLLEEACNGWDRSWRRLLLVLSNRRLGLLNFLLFDVRWSGCRLSFRLLTLIFFRRCPYLLIVTDLDLGHTLWVVVLLLLDELSHGWEKVLELRLIEWIKEILMLHQLDL